MTPIPVLCSTQAYGQLIRLSFIKALLQLNYNPLLIGGPAMASLAISLHPDYLLLFWVVYPSRTSEWVNAAPPERFTLPFVINTVRVTTLP